MKSTATSTCPTRPTFCISRHNEPAGVEPVHLDRDTRVEASNGYTTVTMEQMDSADAALIWVDDKAFTAVEAEALISAITARILTIRTVSR